MFNPNTKWKPDHFSAWTARQLLKHTHTFHTTQTPHHTPHAHLHPDCTLEAAQHTRTRLPHRSRGSVRVGGWEEGKGRREYGKNGLCIHTVVVAVVAITTSSLLSTLPPRCF